jgi:hypothetical protein
MTALRWRSSPSTLTFRRAKACAKGHNPAKPIAELKKLMIEQRI